MSIFVRRFLLTKAKIEIAKKMLEMDLPIEQIIQLTGLTKKDIEKMKVTK